MTTRFEVERAVLASGLPSSERLIMLVLLTHADVDPVTIPAKFTPSLSGLSGESGLDRTTVARILSRLESHGWVRRQRPPVEQSRKGARTRYRLTVPALVAQDHQLVAPRHQPGGATPLAVVAQDRMGSGTTPLRSIHPTDTNQSNRRTRADEIAAVIKALRDRTEKTIDEHQAGLVVDQLLDGRRNGQIRTTTVRYLIGAIAKDLNPERFLPTPTPPPVHEVLGIDPPNRPTATPAATPKRRANNTHSPH